MTENGERLRILCVDDEPHLLEAIARGLRHDYDVTTAASAADGLAAIAQQPAFAIVVSDLRMPGRDGISFLSEVHRVAPDTVRVLLTGNADLDGAIAAINEGHIFKFLTKPLPLPQGWPKRSPAPRPSTASLRASVCYWSRRCMAVSKR